MKTQTILKSGIFLISISTLLICLVNPGYALLMDDASDQDVSDSSSPAVNAQGMLINKDDPNSGMSYQVVGLSTSQGAQLPQDPSSRLRNAEPIDNEPSPEYAQGEVLVKFKDGSDPDKVLSSLSLKPGNIERIYPIKKAVTKFKKDYMLEKDSEGWYSFMGKNYKEVSDIPDEEAFQEAYSKMPETEKALYRSYKVILPEGVSVKAAVKTLSGDPNVEYAEPNYVMKAKEYPQTLPNDTYVDPDHDGAWSAGAWGQTYEDMWGVKKIEADKAWPDSQGEGTVVAVIDTGADYDHEDLVENIWTNADEIPDNGIDDDGNGYVDDVKGWNFSGNNNDPMDKYGHGTHVSGTIAALGDNNKGIIGVAPRAKIMLLKGLSDAGGGYTDDLRKCIIYAASNGAKVLSNSWGPSSRLPVDRVLEDAVDYAYGLGCVVVFAAGNSDDDAAFYSPANYSKVISVAASTPLDKKASFSNWGWLISVTAPGGDNSPFNPGIKLGASNMLSLNARDGDNYIAKLYKKYGDATIGNKYLRLAGTSMACPHVSAVAALVMSYSKDVQGKNLSSDEVKEIIKLSADPIVDPLSSGVSIGSYNQVTGAGRINAKKAIEICKNNASIPIVRITSPQNLSNWANHPNIEISGVVSGEGISSGMVSLEYYFYSDNTNSTIKDSPVVWKPCQAVTYDPASGAIHGIIDLSTISQGWITLRLRANAPLGPVYDYRVLKTDYLELFQLTAPNFDLYGYKKDFLVGQRGPLNISYSVPSLDYNRLGIQVQLTAEYRYLKRLPAPGPVKIGSVTNPAVGTWACDWDTSRIKDGSFYDIIFTKKLTVSGKTYSVTDYFYNNTMGRYYHVNNTYIYTPYHNSIYHKPAGPIEITGYSVSPVKRVEAGVGGAPSAWRTLPITFTSRDGYSEFTGELNPADFDTSYENLINIRVINDVQGKEVENECIAIIIAGEDMDPAFPVRSANYQGTFESVVGDVNGDTKDEVVVATTKVDYAWTTKDYYSNQVMSTLLGCYIYHDNGQLDESALVNSEQVMGQDVEGGGRQYIHDLSLADLDSVPGKEIIMGLDKIILVSPYPRKKELLTLDMNGRYPAAWPRRIDDEFSTDITQRMAVVDADRTGDPKIFLDTMTSNSRKFSLVDACGRTIAEKDVKDIVPGATTIYSGDSLASGDIDCRGNADIFININNMIPRSDNPDKTRMKDHPLLLDAATLDVVRELPLPPDDGKSGCIYTSPIAANLDEDKDLELLFMKGQYETRGNLTAVVFKIYAYNPDGTIVSGWPCSSGLPSDTQWWRMQDFRAIDANGDGKAEIIVKETGLDMANIYDTHCRIRLIDSSGTQVCTMNIPQNYSVWLEDGVVLDMNNDGRMEFIAPVFCDNLSYKDDLGNYGFISWFHPYGILFAGSDGSISKIRYVSGYPRLGVGNIDDDPATELVAVYDHADINMSDTHEPGLYNEIAAFDIIPSYKPESIPWSQALGNAQRTNIYEKPNIKPPVINEIGDKVIDENRPLSFTITASDAEDRRLSYQSPSGMPTGAVFADNGNGTALFTWSPDYNQTGVYSVTFTVSDGDLIASKTITITVNNVNRPPVIDPVRDQELTENQPWSLQLNASDPDGDRLYYSFNNWDSSLRGLTITPDGLLSWKPDYNQAGDYTIDLIVSDVPDHTNDYIKTYFQVKIKVINVNRPPVIVPIGNKTIDEGKLLTFTVSSKDPDGDNLSYSANNLPDGATIDPTTSLFSWKPTHYQAGTYKPTFTVSDGSLTVSDTITITVRNINGPPQIEPIGDKTVKRWEWLRFIVRAADPDNDRISYYLINKPQGAHISIRTGEFVWRPNINDVGDFKVTVLARDSKGNQSSQSFTITVPNASPVLNPVGDKTIRPNQTLSFRLDAYDPDRMDDHRLRFYADNLPRGASLHPVSGIFRWRPAKNQTGTYTVSFGVRDPFGLNDEKIVTIYVK